MECTKFTVLEVDDEKIVAINKREECVTITHKEWDATQNWPSKDDIICVIQYESVVQTAHYWCANDEHQEKIGVGPFPKKPHYRLGV